VLGVLRSDTCRDSALSYEQAETLNKGVGNK
jgi:hypothetical protein